MAFRFDHPNGRSSKKILAALSVSLVPMCNAFFIMLIVAMICAHHHRS
jgi:hypothetical protein